MYKAIIEYMVICLKISQESWHTLPHYGLFSDIKLVYTQNKK